MLQAAAARLTVPLQRIRCITCRYPTNIIVTCEVQVQVQTGNRADANSEHMYSVGGITHDIQAHHQQAGHDIKHCAAWLVDQ